MTNRELLAAWTFPVPAFLAGVALLALHRASGGLRSARRTAALGAALALAALALASPLAVLAAGYLFSAHMLQHLLLVLAIPPLLLGALPPSRTPLCGPRSRRGPLAGPLAALLRRPVVTWGAGIGAMWIWHAQTLCNAAATSDAVRGLQTASLLAMGAAFYWPILAPHEDDRLDPLRGAVYLFSACVGCTLLGILVTFSPLEVCPAFLHPADPHGLVALIRDGWGVGAAQDQQIAGLIMWVPACLVYGSGILGLLARWYGAEGAR
jgi:cytochrome c oxidase assembly factor CtaG